jgi:hypothetical protein
MNAGWLGITSTDGQDPLKAITSDAGEMTGHADALTVVIRDIDQRMAKLQWWGDDRVTFEMNWNDKVRPELEFAAKTMRAKAEEMITLAVAQARASGGAYG